MAPSLNHPKDLRDFIKLHTVNNYKYRGQPQRFLPATFLDKVTQREVIKRIIEQDEKVILSNHGQEALIEQAYQDGRKLFAICIMCGKSMKYLKAMLENGLTDASLPLAEHDFGSLAQKETFVDSFMVYQKRVNAIFFAKDSIQNLDDNISDRFSIPIHFEEKDDNKKGKGAFGEVWVVKMHPDQRSFPCETNEGGLFAMKVTQHEGRERDYHRAMAGLDHQHLVKCLASFTLGAKYQMVYDLANCNLEELIKSKSDAGAHGLTTPWLAQQLAGLAGALQVVHNPDGSTQAASANTLSVPSPKSSKTGYIHDIKPENILVFRKRDGVHWLRLSDFSCAKVVDFVATISGKRDSYKTGTKSGTPIYRAPESSSVGATSRPYDMWSLGCVYLEILVWFIDGYDALMSFRDDREDEVCPNGLIDEGFYHEVAPGNVQLREPVVEKIEYLSRRCEGGLRDIVDTIPSLLKINPKDRLDASQLVAKLRHLDTGTNSNVGSRPSHTTLLPVCTSTAPNLPTWDSDSDFGDVVTITYPSDE